MFYAKTFAKMFYSRRLPVALKHLCKCFILHVTTSKKVLATVKILQNSGLVLVAQYSQASIIAANHCFLGSREKDVVLGRDAITQQ